MMLQRAVVDLHMQMEIYMMDNGQITCQMAVEFTNTRMDLPMKVNGKMRCLMVPAIKHTVKAHRILVNFKTERSMDKDATNGMMVPSIWDNGTKTFLKAPVQLTSGEMANSI